MRYENVEYLIKKIEAMQEAKEHIKAVMPTTKIGKIKFNLTESKYEPAMKMYKLALSLTGKETDYTPVDNYEILVESIKVLEAGIMEQASLKRLCVYANALKFNDRVQSDFDTAVRKNNKDRCILIISDERRKAEDAERVRKELQAQAEHDKFRKHVLEVQHALSRYMDEDGRPKFKTVNIGMMNNALKTLYTEEEIIEGYKEFLDTNSFSLLIQMIAKKLRKDA